MTFSESLHILWLTIVTIFYCIAGIGLFKTRFKETVLKYVKIMFYILLVLTILAIANSPTIYDAIMVIIRTSACLVFSLYFFIAPLGNFTTHTDHLWDKSEKFAKPIMITSLVLLVLFFFAPAAIGYLLWT